MGVEEEQCTFVVAPGGAAVASFRSCSMGVRLSTASTVAASRRDAKTPVILATASTIFFACRRGAGGGGE